MTRLRRRGNEDGKRGSEKSWDQAQNSETPSGKRTMEQGLGRTAGQEFKRTRARRARNSRPISLDLGYTYISHQTWDICRPRIPAHPFVMPVHPLLMLVHPVVMLVQVLTPSSDAGTPSRRKLPRGDRVSDANTR